MRLKSVVFPEPFGPMTLTSSPAWTSSVVLSAAATPPNRFVSPSISSSGRAGTTPDFGVAQESSIAAPRDGAADCCSRLSAATRRTAGQSPSRRNSIIRTRIRPKISSREVMSWTFWRYGLPTARPRAFTQDVSSWRISDWRNARMSAARTTPRTEPMPPSTTMTRIMTETGNWNISGVAVVSLATWNVPASPAIAAPIANASSL